MEGGIFVLVFVGFVIMLSPRLLAMIKTAQQAVTEAKRVDFAALADAELQDYLPDKKMAAAERYRELTGVGLAEAQWIIDIYVDFPELDEKKAMQLYLEEARAEFEMKYAKGSRRKHKLNRLADENQGAGVRDLIAERKLDEAAEVYAQFMGVDAFTARAAIEEMARDLQQK